MALDASVEQDDWSVIRAVQQGDVEQFAILVDRYQTMAIQVAYGLVGNEQDARDVAQEALVSAYQGLKRFRGESKFSTWLYRIVANKCKDLYRKRARRPGTISLNAPLHAGEENLFIEISDNTHAPHEGMVRSEITRAFSQALGQLPEKQRTAFVLHHLDGLTLEDVAAVMHCRLGTVKTHVYRACQYLRRHLQPWLQEV